MLKNRMKISIVTIVLLVLLAGVIHAAPFTKQFHFVQPDGKSIDLWGQGDEFYADFETLDGYTVVFDPAMNAYYYARLTADGNNLESTGQQVGKVDPKTLGVPQHLRIRPGAIQQKARANFQEWDQVMELTKRWNETKAAWRAAEAAAAGEGVMAPPNFTTTGTKIGLTVLIDFPDAPWTISQAEIRNFCNLNGYANYGNNGSVMNYFRENSKSLLTYSNVVTIYIRMTKPKSFYNDTTKICFGQGALLLSDALAILKARPDYSTVILPTFNNLTVDSANRVTCCNVFFAGADSGVWNYGLWPNSTALGSPVELSSGGKKVRKFQITNIGNALELGTFCHENGHMLCGFPDIYDYDYDSRGGAGVFCLMNSGGHGGNPAQICAYLKRAAGWATVIDLTSASTLVGTLKSSSADPLFNRFYRYQKPGVPTEYFLLENRQKTGRDANLPASGIAIWHIDELGNRDNQSLTPNATHANYEVTLVQADNQWHFQNNVNSGDANDLYRNGNSAGAYNNTFKDNSTPNAHWWNGALSGANFYNFSASSVSMTFNTGPVNNPDSYETDNTAAAASTIANGVTQNHSIHVTNDVDWAKFTIGPYGASNAVIETDGASGDTQMWLYGPNNSTTFIEYDDDDGNGSFSLIARANLAAGTYYIKVQEYGTNHTISAYTLRARWNDRPDSYESDNTAATAKTIASGATQSRNIHAAGNVDWAKFTVGANQTIRIETGGASGDTQLWLYGPNNSTNLIQYDDDGGLNYWSLITRANIAAGTYYIKVTEYGNNRTIPAYTLRYRVISQDSYEPDDTAAAAKTIAKNVLQGRTIHAVGNLDWVKFTVASTVTSVVIQTSGTTGEGDTQLWLYGPNNSTTLIAYNDDYNGRWSKITRPTLAPGTYYIKVKDYYNSLIPYYSLRANWN